jgi:tetratricopeptide (TPR) repeat protein
MASQQVCGAWSTRGARRPRRRRVCRRQPSIDGNGAALMRQRKSQLAIQHAYSIRDAAPRTFVFWVHAGTRARFEEAYRGIAARLKLPGRDHPEANILQLVYNWLQDEANGAWLMILDNADDVDVFYPKQEPANDRSGSPSTSLTEYLPQTRNGSILITSRNKDTAARLAGGHRNINEIVTFGEDQALRLLRNKLHDTLESEGASELLRTLGYLPLAITQAAAYLNRHAPRLTILEYLDEFHESSKRKNSLLNQDGGDLRRDKSASNSVVTTWQLTFECVRKERPSAAELLSLMSFFNPQAIPEFALQSYNRSAKERTSRVKDLFSLLQQPRNREESDVEVRFNNDLAVLQAYSLVSATAERGVLKMHPLVQHCTTAWLSSTKKAELWKLAFIKLMEREVLSKKPVNWEERKQLVPHIDSFYFGEAGSRLLDRWISLTIDAGDLFFRKGRYNEAAVLYKRALEGKEEKLGEGHLDTLMSVTMLASVLFHQGKYNEAEELYQGVREGYNRELGVHHPRTLNVVNNLASTYRCQGRCKEAEELDVQLLEMRKRVLGEEHQDTLISMGNLALTYMKQGRWIEAEELWVQVLESRKRVLGEGHLETLISMNNLAMTYKEQGRLREAKELGVQVLEIRKMVLGEGHPDTLTSIANLALTYKEQGRLREAKELGVQVLEIRKRVLGEEHPDTLTSIANLALTYKEQGRWREAEEMQVQVLETIKRVLGEGHLDTLTSMSNLAHTWKSQSRNEEAIVLMERCFELQKQILGTHHPYTKSSLNALSQWRMDDLYLI